MAKKNLFMGTAKDERSFLEKLTVAYAPFDDLVMRTARETGNTAAPECTQEESDTSDRKHGLGVKFAVRHLGSI